VPTLAELQQFARYHLVRRVYDHPARDPELEVVTLGYDPKAFEAEVRSFEGRFAVREALRGSYRGASWPVLEVESKPSSEARRRRVLVLSGVHGNEQAGILSVVPLLEQLYAERASLANVAVRVLTPVNAVGAAEVSRFNGEGYDINRDFRRFYTAEARLVRDALESFRPDIVLSLHEGPQDASFVFANARCDVEQVKRWLSEIEAKGTTLARKDYFGSMLPSPGLSPSTAASRLVVRLWANTLGMMAANGYCDERGIPELTLESSWKSPDRAARLRAHVDLCMAVVRTLARQ